jgi:hypothetical protein
VRFDIERREGTELRNLALLAPPQELVSLAVSPDGMQMAMTLRGGFVEVMPAAGGQSREVFRPAAPEIGTGSLRQALSWTPDGRFLLWARGDSSLWRVPALGGGGRESGSGHEGQDTCVASGRQAARLCRVTGPRARPQGPETQCDDAGQLPAQGGRVAFTGGENGTLTKT